MIINPSVNRYLKDADMDCIDHALGRPAWPMVKSHRNYYAATTNSKLAAKMTASPFWTDPEVQGAISYFYVSEQGRAALAAHLKEIGDRNRVYEITLKPGNVFGAEGKYLVVSESASRARYSAFLSATDAYDFDFLDVQRSISVRLAPVPGVMP